MRDLFHTRGDVAQQSSHDLAAACLWKAFGEADDVWASQSTDFFADVLGEFFLERVIRRAIVLCEPVGTQRDERADRVAFDVVRETDDGGFSNGGVAHEGAFDFHRAQQVAADFDDVVDATLNPEVAIVIAACAVGGEVVRLAGLRVFDAAPVVAHKAIAIAVDTTEHPGPGFADDKQAAFIRGKFFTLFVDDRGVDAEHRKRATTGLGGNRAGERCDDVAASFSLPIRVDDGAWNAFAFACALAANVIVVPHPCFGVDRFADATEHFEAGEIVVSGKIIAPLHEGADCGGGCVEVRDFVAFDDVPETIAFAAFHRWKVRSAFVEERWDAVHHRAVEHV